MLLALVPAQAEVRVELPPPTDGLYAFAPLVVALLVLSALYWIRRRRIRASSRRRAGVMASFALSAALGNALVEMGAMLDPSRPVVMIMERGDCEHEADEAGDGPLPSLTSNGPLISGLLPAASSCTGVGFDALEVEDMEALEPR